MKKISWGYKIIFIYVAFVLGMLFMAYQSSMQKFDLVENDYYAAELKYQDVIDAAARAKALGTDLIIKQEADSVKLLLPAVFNEANVKGKVHLYYPADKQGDKNFYFETLNAFTAFKVSNYKKGNYTIKLELLKSGVTYYYEQKILL